MENIPDSYIIEYINNIYLKIFVLYHTYLTNIEEELNWDIKTVIKTIYKKRLMEFASSKDYSHIYYIKQIKRNFNLNDNAQKLSFINELYNNCILELFNHYDKLKKVPRRLYKKIEDELKVYSLINSNKETKLEFNNFSMSVPSIEYFNDKIKSYSNPDTNNAILSIYHLLLINIIFSIVCIFMTIFF